MTVQDHHDVWKPARQWRTRSGIVIAANLVVVVMLFILGGWLIWIGLINCVTIALNVEMCRRSLNKEIASLNRSFD